MASRSLDYNGRHIELREAEGSGGPSELLIDGVAYGYGQLVDGSYYLYDYAFDQSNDLIDLATRYINYQQTADRIRSERAAQERALVEANSSEQPAEGEQ